MKPNASFSGARRGLAGATAATLAAGLAGAAGPARAAAAEPPGRQTQQQLQQQREALRQRRTPNVPLLDHNGRAVRFYDDVMKDRLVLVNVMYSVCSNVCTPATQNLKQARQLLGAQADGLHFVSLSLTPLSDTPAALKAYKQAHGLHEGWTFLTGTPGNIETAQGALGFISNEDGSDLLDHAGMARLCDERLLRWTHINTLVPPRSIARMIRFELA